jgi:L-arabinokinase
VTVVYYISGHGFGHASRSIELIRQLTERRPAARLIVRTSAPAWLFQSTAPPAIELIELETDLGVVQIDSLNVDEDETIRRAAAFYTRFDQRVEAEAAFLRGCRATVVVGDIPPLAFAAAARAGIPSVAVANFTWDWIYEAYERFRREAAWIINTIRTAYALATRALRLPLHGGFGSMMAVTTDIPFIARRSSRDRLETRERLGIAAGAACVLASFSAADLALPSPAIAEAEGLTILAPTREPPAGLTYPDLVAAADVVVSKPGYGIVSECVANGTPLLYTSRGQFAEYDVFVEHMPRLLRCRYLPPADFHAGKWGTAVRALLRQESPATRPRMDGAEEAAEAILNLVASAE